MNYYLRDPTSNPSSNVTVIPSFPSYPLLLWLLRGCSVMFGNYWRARKSIIYVDVNTEYSVLCAVWIQNTEYSVLCAVWIQNTVCSVLCEFGKIYNNSTLPGWYSLLLVTCCSGQRCLSAIICNSFKFNTINTVKH